MATYKDKSFWLTTRDYEPGLPLLDSVDVDVAVIGAGFTGLSTAYFLHRAEPGLRIAVLEADVVGFGASGRNAGFSMTKIGMLNSITKLRFGRQSAVEAHAYADRAVSLVRDLVRELDLDCDYEHPGLLTVATSTAHARRLDKELALADELGIKGVERIDADALAERVESPLYVGDGWWEPNCGILNPAKLAWSWKRVIESAGIEVFEETPVLEVSRTGSSTMLTTPRGRVRAAKVVFATNAWSHQFPGLRSKQVPVWTYIVLTEPLTDTQLGAVGWAGREGIEDFRDLVHYYRLTADNRIVFGGRDVGVWDGDSMAKDRDETIFAKLRADLTATFPALGEVRFTHAWGGPVSATIDLFPALGYVGGRDWVYSLGCVGHGVSTTHLNGQTIKDLVLERDTDLTDTFFVNRRVPPMPPGPLTRPVIGAIAGFMRWEDKRLDVLPG
ncbi:MAG TPA: FAD-dependent oxidoreductase [Nocardioidaceae bacterium]